MGTTPGKHAYSKEDKRNNNDVSFFRFSAKISLPFRI